MTTVNFDETMIIAIYGKDTRSETVKAINEMLPHLGESDTELRALATGTIAKLEAMTDREFKKIDLEPAHEMLDQFTKETIEG